MSTNPYDHDHDNGPWAFKPGKDNGMSIIHRYGDPEFIIGYAICEANNNQQRIEDLANARVMTVAPDLFRACVRALAVLNAACDSDDEMKHTRAELERVIKSATQPHHAERESQKKGGKQ